MEPRGIHRERNGWSNHEHSARVRYDEHQELDVSERLYRERGYHPPFEELPWLDETANNASRQQRFGQERRDGIAPFKSSVSNPSVNHP
jgi:hypothetical protein